MKTTQALMLSAALAAVAAPTYAIDPFLDNVGIYGAGTYTKPSNNGLSMGFMETVFPQTSFYPFDRALFLEPEFTWEYMLGISYRFCGTDTRAYIEYDYFNDSDSRQANGVALLNQIPFYDFVGHSFTIPNVTANVLMTSNEWRGGFRHFLHFGSRFFMDLSAFFEYDKISQTVHEYGVIIDIDPTGATPPDYDSVYQETNNSFHGWGPGVGLKLIGIPFSCWPCWSLFAGASTTLFYAQNNFNAYATAAGDNNFSGPNDIEALMYRFDPESSKSLLTKIDINFGVDYRRMLNVAGCKFRSGATLGVRYMNINNAFKNGNSALNIPQGANGVGLILPLYGVANDWGRVGPYLQVRVGGANA